MTWWGNAESHLRDGYLERSFEGRWFHEACFCHLNGHLHFREIPCLRPRYCAVPAWRDPKGILKQNETEP